jgi:long-subunit acyl-CoA synthetase (AMP-forming)
MLTVDAQKALSNGAADKETLRRDLDKLLQQVNATLEDHEHLDYIVVVKEQWTMENGFLTPTMKIKRNIIEERYLSRADHWLKQRAPVILEH